MNCGTVTIWEAWSLWLSGEEVKSCSLWGLQILWWGRIGKIVTAVSALVVIIDIIGEERLRNFGTSASQNVSSMRQKIQAQSIKVLHAFVVFCIVVFLLYALEGFIEADTMDTLGHAVLNAAVYVASGVFAMQVLDEGIIKPMIAVLPGTKLSMYTRTLSLFLLVCGFHFDLLSS